MSEFYRKIRCRKKGTCMNASDIIIIARRSAKKEILCYYAFVLEKSIYEFVEEHFAGAGAMIAT